MCVGATHRGDTCSARSESERDEGELGVWSSSLADSLSESEGMPKPDVRRGRLGGRQRYPGWQKRDMLTGALGMGMGIWVGRSASWCGINLVVNRDQSET